MSMITGAAEHDGYVRCVALTGLNVQNWKPLEPSRALSFFKQTSDHRAEMFGTSWWGGGGCPEWGQFNTAHLLLLEDLLLVWGCLFVLVSVLFGTTFNELLGKVLGLKSVPQIGPDVVVHLVRRVHFFQEGCKRGNWQSSRGGTAESGFRKHPINKGSCCTLLKAYHPDYWLC